jgi:hypothetical protein
MYLNLVKNVDQYDENNIYFSDPIKNNIINEGNFIRILYSNSNIIFNGIFLLLSFHNIVCEKYFNKYKCIINTNYYKDIIDKMKNIEETILKKSNIQNKIPIYRINEQLKNGKIKIFDEIKTPNCSFIFKISGIWETNQNYGLTYKIIKTKGTY